MVNMKKNPLNTSLRSETQAIDSARRGWTAKSAATKALRHRLPVFCRKTNNSKTAVAACQITLTR